MPPLWTERLTLRELKLKDAPAVAAGAGDPSVAQYLLAVPSPYPIALARAWVRGRIGWAKTGRGATLGIARRESPGALLGTVSLRKYARDRRAELGYWLAAAAWAQGIATEAARAMIDYGFRELELARVYAYVLGGNTASMRVLEKLGLQREGKQRQHVLQRGTLHDITIYGVLASEWPRRA